MIMGHLNLKALIVIFALPFVCLSCTETFGTDDKQQASVPTTKALSPDFGWICNECHFLNGGWRNNCLSRGASCDKILSSLTITFAKEIERELKFSPYTEEQAKKALENDPNLLELPTMLFAEHSPEPWFDTKEALEYYEAETNSISYTNPRYAEGIDLGWYKTSRILYPEYHDKTSVQRLFDRFRLTEGRNWKSDYELGIKAGASAAVEAFLDYQP